MKKLLLPFISLAVSSAFSAEYTLKVDLQDSIRPVTHCASGALYGVTEQYPTDIQAMIGPLKCHMFCQPGAGGNGNQHPFGDALKVAERLKGTDAKVQITLADILPNWPYKWPGLQSWLSQVEDCVKRVKASGLTNIHSYVIWNEPYGTWNDSNGDFHSTVWKPTYELLRKLDPDAKLVGPGLAYYSQERMEKFVKFCKENNCLPDIICWHQWGSGGFAGAVENMKSLEKKYDLPDFPMCINEYCAGSSAETQKYEGCPGYSVPFISKFERYKVESATISWWFTNLPGRLGSLLTANNEKGGGWYLYKWYGDMEGYMAKVTPPNDKSDGVDGFAAVNRKQKEASIILGGSSLGTVNVEIQGIPNWMGGEVEATVECVTWEDKDKAVPAPHEVSSGKFNVVDGKISVPVSVTNAYYAYRIFIVPGEVIPQSPFDPNNIPTIPGTIEAENYDLGSAGVSYYDKDKENRGDVYRDDAVDVYESDEPNGYAVGYAQEGEWLLYTVNIEKEANYDIKARLSCGNTDVGIKLYIDDKPITGVISSETTNDNKWDSYIDVDAKTIDKLPAGEHTLKMEIVGNWINIDRLTFASQEGTSLINIYTDEAVTYTVWDASGRMIGSVTATGDITTALKNSGMKRGVYIVKSADGSKALTVVVD